MQLKRDRHWRFLEDEMKAESEAFVKKFEARADHLLLDTQEMFVGKFVAFRDGEMIVKFANTRNLPRKGEFLFCMLLPQNLRDYRKWGDKTYKNLYDERFKGTESVCIWQSATDDPCFSLVGFRRIDIDFAAILEKAKDVVLVFAPNRPPLEYVKNLQTLVANDYSNSVSSVLDADFNIQDWVPTILQDNVSDFVFRQLTLTDTIILQGPPGTGKTYMIAELCRKLCLEGKSILVSAMTNRALMEIAEKPALKELLSSGKVLKTNMTVDESRELSELTSVKEILPIPGSIVLSTYFITSGFAVNLATEQSFDYIIMDEASQALLAMFAASKKIARKQLWVGDVCQLSPIVSLNEDIVESSNYKYFINGLELLSCATSNPIFQLSKTYRFGDRAAKYTGVFYNDTLVAVDDKQYMSYGSLSNIFSAAGGPTCILTDLDLGDYAPDFLVQLVAFLVGTILKEHDKKHIAVLSCFIKTVKALQKSIVQFVTKKSNVLVETVARVQGLTTDIIIFVIPNVSYIRSLEEHLFNVATSRAKEHTIIIADKNIFKCSFMNDKVRTFMERLREEQCVYVPRQQVSGFLDSANFIL